jgi:hypothetical protein
MPLKTGSSRKVVSSNIKELVGTYKDKGRIGSSRPTSKTAAIKQAIAISLNKSRDDKRMAAGGAIEVRRNQAYEQGRKNFISSPPDKTGTSITTRKQISAIRKKGGSVTYKKDGKLPVGVY